MKRELTPGWGTLIRDRRVYWVTLFGRLKPGISRERAEAEINVAYQAQLEQDVQLLRSPSSTFLERFRSKKSY